MAGARGQGKKLTNSNLVAMIIAGLIITALAAAMIFTPGLPLIVAAIGLWVVGVAGISLIAAGIGGLAGKALRRLLDRKASLPDADSKPLMSEELDLVDPDFFDKFEQDIDFDMPAEVKAALADIPGVDQAACIEMVSYNVNDASARIYLVRDATDTIIAAAEYKLDDKTVELPSKKGLPDVQACRFYRSKLAQPGYEEVIRASSAFVFPESEPYFTSGQLPIYMQISPEIDFPHEVSRFFDEAFISGHGDPRAAVVAIRKLELSNPDRTIYAAIPADDSYLIPGGVLYDKDSETARPLNKADMLKVTWQLNLFHEAEAPQRDQLYSDLVCTRGETDLARVRAAADEARATKKQIQTEADSRLHETIHARFEALSEANAAFGGRTRSGATSELSDAPQGFTPQANTMGGRTGEDGHHSADEVLTTADLDARGTVGRPRSNTTGKG